MGSKIVVANGVYDLSEINTMKELQELMGILKTNIKKDEADIEKRLRRLPQWAVKSAADSILPSFLNKLIANGTWKILLSGVSVFANPFSRGLSFKKNIVGSVKKLGLLTLAKTAYGYWANKRAASTGRTGSVTTKPEVTTLRAQAIPKKS